MNRVKYTDEVKTKYVDVLGQTFGSIFILLLEEVIFLNSKWLEYRKIYAKSPERIALLNKTAPFFFGILQNILWEDILIGIARLTDPPVSMGRTNLTIQALKGKASEPTVNDRLELLIKHALDSCGFARDWRNRHLAHSDLNLSKEMAKPLPELSRAKTQDAINSIIAILKMIEAHYFDAESNFEIMTGGTANDLIFYLNWGKFVSEQEREHLKEGKEFQLPPNV